MQCSALDYKSFLDTVQVELAGCKDMRFLLTNEQKDGVTLRTFMTMSDAHEEIMK